MNSSSPGQIKWSETFPAIVSKARTIEVISSGSQSGYLQLVVYSSHAPLILSFGVILVSAAYFVVVVSRCMRNYKCFHRWFPPGNCICSDLFRKSSKDRGP